MKKFKVTASYITYLSAEIEAESLEEAEQMAQDLDGGLFDQDGSEDWSIDAVTELSEAAR